MPALSSLFFEFSLHKLFVVSTERAYGASSFSDMLKLSNTLPPLWVIQSLLHSLQAVNQPPVPHLKKNQGPSGCESLRYSQSISFLTSCQQLTQMTTLWFLEHFSLDSIHFCLSFHPSNLSRLFFLMLLSYQKQVGSLKLLLIISVTSNFYSLKHSEEIKTLTYELYTLPGKYPHCLT